MSITIKADIGIDDTSAMYYVLKVIQEGRVSNYGKEYCYASTFSNGVRVYSHQTKGGNDVFIVSKQLAQNAAID